MLCRTLVCTFAVLAVSAVGARGDDKADLAAAVNKLADAPSYAWTTTTNSQFVRGPSDGKTEKGGYTSVTLAAQDVSYPAIMQGDKAVIKTESGWQTPAEITAGGEGGFNPMAFVAGSLIGFKAPAEQLKGWADKLENVKKEGDVYTATLSTDAAREVLTFRGGRGGRGGGAGGAAPQMTVNNPKGALKIWVANGAVSKMELHSTGSISVGGNDRDVDRTTTTEIKEVGTAKVTVPDDARKKLDAAPASPPSPAAPAGR